jgi:hypothetical protein
MMYHLTKVSLSKLKDVLAAPVTQKDERIFRDTAMLDLSVYILQEDTLQNHRCENLKSYKITLIRISSNAWIVLSVQHLARRVISSTRCFWDIPSGCT